MKDKNVVYCVQCGSVKDRGSAEIIFKTGFYNTTIPLAHCKDCVYSKKTEIELNIHINNEECFEASIASSAQFD